MSLLLTSIAFSGPGQDRLELKMHDPNLDHGAEL